MKVKNLIADKYICVLYFILLTFILLHILLKLYNLGAFFDEAGFIYRSWRILAGDILYKDIGDIRTPGHYFFFIVPFMFLLKTIRLSPVSIFVGLRVILSIWLVAAFYFVYLTLIHLGNSKKVSIMLITAIVLSPLVMGWSTYLITENIFFLPFSAGIYYYFKKRYFLAGMLLGSSLLIRHSLFILFIPIIVYLIFKKNLKSIRNFIIGGAIPLAGIVLYLITTGALSSFVYYILRGPHLSSQWFIPPSLKFVYDHYLELPIKLDPAIDLILILSVISIFKFKAKNEDSVLIYIYICCLCYWVYTLTSSYNTKYILPLIYISIFPVSIFLNGIKSKIKRALIMVFIVLTVFQSIMVFSTDYLVDPARNDNFITPFLQEQITMAEFIKKYNISDKEWFTSYQLIVPYFTQIDCYSHLSIKSSYTFPSKEELIPVLSKTKLVMLDPRTNSLMKSAWVDDSDADLYLMLSFKINGLESTINDGFDVFMKSGESKEDEIITVRFHTNPAYSEHVEYRENNVLIHKSVKQDEWMEIAVPVSKIFINYYNSSPDRIYISLVVNSDKSTLSVVVNKIEIFDNFTGLVLYFEDFEPIGGTLEMKISNGYYKYRIGYIGNGALTYLNLNYVEVEKIPIHRHQNEDKIVYIKILLNKNYYSELHKQHILGKIVTEPGS